MNAKRRRLKSYYLRLNGYKIIDFNEYHLGSDLDDFVRLNLFTSSFDEIDELCQYLMKHKIIPKSFKMNKIEIVKAKKIKEDIIYYKYYHVSNEPLLKRDYPFFNTKMAIDFMKLNMYNYGAMREIIKDQKDIISEIIEKVKKSDKQRYITDLYDRKSNIDRLLVLIGYLMDSNTIDEEEYIKRLKYFIETTVLYIRDNSSTTNYKGLLDIAKSISKVKYHYKNLIIPPLYKEDYSINNKIPHRLDSLEVDSDPDDYMFLEDEDFYNIESSKTTVLEDQIANLEEKKRKF